VLASCALLLVVAGVGTVRALAVVARHRAESSADLVALAGAGEIGVADDECAAAARIATSNGVRLHSCRVAVAADGRSGTVSVVVAGRVDLPLVGSRDVTATARAGRRPPA
jgi:secretion/DNA translocation related TadE-like protein